MKKFLWLVFIFILIGCRPNPLQPLTHPDQRIQFGGFSFLPPPGKNWEVHTNPIENNIYWETWGRSTLKATIFNKNIVEPNYRSRELETLQLFAIIYEFAIMKFDNEDDLLELTQDGYRFLGESIAWFFRHRLHFYDDNYIKSPHSLEQSGKKGIIIPESRYTFKIINKMNCATIKIRTERVIEIAGFEHSEVIAIHYIQKFICVHPSHPNQIIKFGADHAVLKGKTPTDIQSELDPFFNSLQFH